MTGRKLYLYWGKTIVAIEKIKDTPEVRERLMIKDLGDPLKDSTKHAHLLFALGDWGLGTVTSKLGDPAPSDVGGREIQEYFTNMQYWTTPEERADGNE